MNTALNDLLDQLTQPGISTIQRETFKNGKRTGTRPEYVTAPALLEQLRDAIVQGMEQGGGSAFGSRLPLAANALDIWNEIEAEATALYVGLASHLDAGGKQIGLRGMFWEYPHGDEKPGYPSDLTGEAEILFSTTHPRVAPLGLDNTIRQWLDTLATDVQTHIAQRILRRWVNRILGLLKPEPKCDISGTCPDSGSAHYLDKGKRLTALFATFNEAGEVEVHSRVTGRVWSGEKELREIGFHIGVELDPVAFKAMWGIGA
jgi:hypothetical protein